MNKDDQNPEPGWAMKDDADMSWSSVRWPRHWQLALLVLSLALVAFNAVRLWG